MVVEGVMKAVWVGEQPWGVAVGDLRQGSARIMLLFSAWERPPTGVCSFHVRDHASVMSSARSRHARIAKICRQEERMSCTSCHGAPLSPPEKHAQART